MTYTDPTTVSPEDIDDLNDAPSALDERPSFNTARPGVRDSVREDIDHVRAKARAKAAEAEVAIREHPIQSTAWALVAGVLLGVLLAR